MTVKFLKGRIKSLSARLNPLTHAYHIFRYFMRLLSEEHAAGWIASRQSRLRSNGTLNYHLHSV